MSKLAKVCAVFLPIGFVFSIVGGIIMSMNESPDFDVSTACESADTTMTYDDCYEGSDEADEMTGSNSFDRDEADAVVIDCTAASINLYSSPISYFIDPNGIDWDYLTMDCTDGTINVKYDEKGLSYSDGGTLDISVPDTCKKITIRCNAGDIQISDFIGDDIDISVDCGDVTIRSAKIQNSCKVSNTLGSVRLYESDVKGLDADLVSGNIDIQHTYLSGYNALNVDVGDCDVTLNGYAGNYTVDAKVKVGELSCDYDLSENTYSDNKLDISVLAGNCSIYFNDDFNE